MTTPDGALKPALTRLADAISALCDPVMQIVDGRRLWTASWYTQLVDAVPGNQGEGGGGTRLVVVWIDALLLCMEIDEAVAAWQPTGEDTTARLHALEDRWKSKGRPQDCRSIDQISDAVETWKQDIMLLLNPVPTLRPRVPCPDCGEKWVHERDSAGEIVQRPALQVSAEGCRCHRCRTLWTPDMWGLLERRIKDENTDLTC